MLEFLHVFGPPTDVRISSTPSPATRISLMDDEDFKILLKNPRFLPHSKAKFLILINAVWQCREKKI